MKSEIKSVTNKYKSTLEDIIMGEIPTAFPKQNNYKEVKMLIDMDLVHANSVPNKRSVCKDWEEFGNHYENIIISPKGLEEYKKLIDRRRSLRGYIVTYIIGILTVTSGVFIERFIQNEFTKAKPEQDSKDTKDKNQN